jgi:Fe-S-cluster containining protein
MFKNPERYFGSCDNCGDCCRIPGIFLPPEVDLLGNHLGMDREELFRRFLIAELFTPTVKSSPAFVISPVKQAGGKRYADLLSDHGYVRALRQTCIFRDGGTRSCGVHGVKPFGCTLLICGKMTKARPIMLNKTYYYHRWAGAQDILFSIFPKLERVYRNLLEAVGNLPDDDAGRRAALKKGNEIIRDELSRVLNGHSGTGRPFYG